jgi:hypothetical protein
LAGNKTTTRPDNKRRESNNSIQASQHETIHSYCCCACIAGACLLHDFRMGADHGGKRCNRSAFFGRFGAR